MIIIINVDYKHSISQLSENIRMYCIGAPLPKKVPLVWKGCKELGKDLKKGPWESKIARMMQNDLVTLERGQ